MLEILPNIFLDEAELTFTASRSSGPGGQHVNKTSTRITLTFNPATSATLSSVQKQLIYSKLASRIDTAGLLQITAQSSRSQHENKLQAIDRLLELLRAALTPQKKRRKTKPTLGSKTRRLESKKKHSQTKSLRRSAPQ